jgi:hypothetical protein
LETSSTHPIQANKNPTFFLENGVSIEPPNHLTPFLPLRVTGYRLMGKIAELTTRVLGEFYFIDSEESRATKKVIK